MIKVKQCKSCKKTLSITEFTQSNRVKDGYENKCKKCRTAERKKNHSNICLSCGKEFKSAIKDQKYCSLECRGLGRRKRVIRKCQFCGNRVEVTISKSNRQDIFYCNQNCRTQDLKSTMKGEGNPNFNRIEYHCDGCNKKILVVPNRLENQKYLFCSNDCYKENIGKYFIGENNPNFMEKVAVKCSNCNKTFYRKPGQLKYKKHYCSRQCYMDASERTEINGKIEVKCSHCGKPFRIYQSRMNIVQNIYCSMECRNIHQGMLYRGENHPLFNSSLTDEERLSNRKYNAYYEWRKNVYARDDYTCQCCGDSKGGNLAAHHIISYRSNKEKQTDIENGITLCKNCHKLFHDNYGYGNNVGEQLNLFLDIFDQLGEDGFRET